VPCARRKRRWPPHPVRSGLRSLAARPHGERPPPPGRPLRGRGAAARCRRGGRGARPLGALRGDRLRRRPAGSLRPARPRVQRQFLGGESDQAPQKTNTGSANAEDVTFADQLKEFWKNPSVQQAFGVLMTASTVLDVFGLFTGEAAVGGGVAEALGTVDATALATEGQGAVEALAEAAESATEATEGAMDSVKEMLTGAKQAP